MSTATDLKALARRLRRYAQGTTLSSLAVPDLEDAADALDCLDRIHTCVTTPPTAFVIDSVDQLPSAVEQMKQQRDDAMQGLVRETAYRGELVYRFARFDDAEAEKPR